METVISVKPKELSIRLIDKIKRLAGEEKGAEILISIRHYGNKGALKKETPAQTKRRIDRAIENVEKRKNLIKFTGEEFETLFNLLTRKAS